jgi:hypothetical protein
LRFSARKKTTKKFYFNKVVRFGMNFGIRKEGVSDKTVKSDGFNVLEISH